jgi:hypothetical protein
MSSSLRKIESARTNGAKSRGAHTKQGRHAFALNAVTHGLTAKTVILQNEPEQEYEAELQSYLHHFRPQDMPEERLVRQLAAAGWRLARYAGVESGLMNHTMDQQTERRSEEDKNISSHERVALAFEFLADNGNALALVNRYQARLQHEYQKILKSLLQMQAARAHEVKLPNRANPVFEHLQTTGDHGTGNANIRVEPPIPATPQWTSPPDAPRQLPRPDDRNSGEH